MPKRAYAIIIAAFFTVSIAYSIRYAYGMLLPEMILSLGISKIQAGSIFATYFIVYTIFSPILGALSDRFNYRAMIFFFTLLLSIGALSMAVAASFVQACLIFSMASLGHAACWAPVVGLVQKWVPDNKRGTALAFVTAGIGLGIPLWSFFLPIIVSFSSWKAGWISLGLFGFCVSILNLVLIRNPVDPEYHRKNVPDKFPQSNYRELFESGRFWRIGISYMFAGLNVLVPFTFLPVYARESLNFSFAVSTRFVAIIAISGVAGQLILGTLSDKAGRIKLMMLCGLIIGTGCLAMIFFHHQFSLYAIAGFYGVGYGAVWPIYAAAARDYFPKRNIGAVVGLWTAFLGVGSIISPIVCGWTIDRTGSYNWAFLIGFFSGLFSALVLFKLLRQRGDVYKMRDFDVRANPAKQNEGV